MQVYRYMDIGTAKITAAETKGVPHHLLDIKDPGEPFSVAEFQSLARAKIAEINAKGKLPFWWAEPVSISRRSLMPTIYGTGEIEPYRQKLWQLAAEQGTEHLYARLRQVDPEAALKIHPHDQKRIIRALEYFHLTGQPISSKTKARYHSPYRLVMIGLTIPRELLYRRIEQRVDAMIANGLLEEVKFLIAQGYSPQLPALQGLGYRQLVDYLNGKDELAEAINQIKKETRRFAKRQLTWFKRDPRIHWFNLENMETQLEQLLGK